MKLLMITRKIDRDDWLAGHSYEWAKKISGKLKSKNGKLAVICLEKGNTQGLEEVEVYSLGKESGASRWQEFWRFQALAFRLVRQCNGIFCHQNPEYAVAIWPWAFIFGKKIVSWYTHKAVTWKTRLMLAASARVLTASPESFRLASPKVKVVGHGIDTEEFTPVPRGSRNSFFVIPSDPSAVADGEPRNLSQETFSLKKDPSTALGMTNNEVKIMAAKKDGIFKIITVGRISPVKNLETLILAMNVLVNEKRLENISLEIFGTTGTPSDRGYFDFLQALVKKTNLERFVSFKGAIPHSQIAGIYQSANLFVNLSRTGSIDKAVLEAAACGVLVLTSNEAFIGALSKISGNLFLAESAGPKSLVDKIQKIYRLPEAEKQVLREELRALVEREHSLDNLVQKIIGEFEQ